MCQIVIISFTFFLLGWFMPSKKKVFQWFNRTKKKAIDFMYRGADFFTNICQRVNEENELY